MWVFLRESKNFSWLSQINVLFQKHRNIRYYFNTNILIVAQNLLDKKSEIMKKTISVYDVMEIL